MLHSRRCDPDQAPEKAQETPLRPDTEAPAPVSIDFLLYVPEQVGVEKGVQVHAQAPADSGNGLDGYGIVSPVDDIVQRRLPDPAADAQRIQRQIVFIAQIQNPDLQCFLGTHFLHPTDITVPFAWPSTYLFMVDR